MSVIVAVRKAREIVIAADTQDNFGDLRPPPENHRAVKLREIGGAVVGSSGWALYDDLLEHYLSRRRVRLHTRAQIFDFFVRFWRELRKSYPFVNDQSGKDGSDSPFASLDSTFLVASPRGIFLVSSNMSVSEFKQYYAIGSGGDYAIGAVHALYDGESDAVSLAQRAVKAGIAYDAYCGGEIELRRVKLAR